MQIEENRRNLKMTVLYREGGLWHPAEISNLCIRLGTEVSGRGDHPNHLILLGHYTKADVLEALGGGMAFTADQVVGVDHAGLPFTPGFI